jgi:hypothetical protein
MMGNPATFSNLTKFKLIEAGFRRGLPINKNGGICDKRMS